MSPAALARTLGVADAQVSRWRRDQVVPNVRSLQRIADTFGVPRATLDRLAGYPVEDDGEADPTLDAAAGRLREVLQHLPAKMRPAYVDACASLAEAFRGSLDALLSEAEQGDAARAIGFHQGQDA